MIWDHFQFVPFLVGLAIGLYAVTFQRPDDTQRIVKYPHPSTVGEFTYRDRNGLCYGFSAEEVSCDKVKENLKDYPYQS